MQFNQSLAMRFLLFLFTCSIYCWGEEYYFFTDPWEVGVQNGGGIERGGPVAGVTPIIFQELSGERTFVFPGDLIFESDDSIRFDRLHTAAGIARPVRIQVFGDLVIPEGMVVDASARGRESFAGGGQGGNGSQTGGSGGQPGAGGVKGTGGAGGAGEVFAGADARFGKIGTEGSVGNDGGRGGEGLVRNGKNGYGTSSGGGALSRSDFSGYPGIGAAEPNQGTVITNARGGTGGNGGNGLAGGPGLPGNTGVHGVRGGRENSSALTGGGGGSSGQGGRGGGGGAGGQGGGGAAGGNGGKEGFLANGGAGGMGGAGSTGGAGLPGSQGRSGGSGGGGGGAFEFVVGGSITLGGKLLARGGDGEAGNLSINPATGSPLATLTGEAGDPGEDPFAASAGGPGGMGGAGGPGGTGGSGGGGGHGAGGAGGMIRLSSNMIRYGPNALIDVSGGRGGSGSNEKAPDGIAGRFAVNGNGREVGGPVPEVRTSDRVQGVGRTGISSYEVTQPQRPIVGDLDGGPEPHGILTRLSAAEFAALPFIGSQTPDNASVVIYRSQVGVEPYNFAFDDGSEWVFIANLSGADLVEPKFIAGRNHNPTPLPTIAAGEVYAMTIGRDVTQFAASHRPNGTLVTASSNTFQGDRFHVLFSAPPTELLVTTLADQLDVPAGPELSLREAIRDANSNEVIRFNPSLFDAPGAAINLTLGELLINKTVSIDGSGLRYGPTLVATSQGSRVLQVTAGGDLTLNKMTLSRSVTSTLFSGGLVYIVAGGSLDAVNCAFLGGQASYGGAIDNYGTCTLVNCSLSENHCTTQGMVIDNNGGAVLTLNHCSISGNTGAGSAVAVRSFSGAVEILENTIIALNMNANGVNGNVDGVIETQNGANLLAGDPLLYLSSGDVSVTRTLVPRAGSPAIDSAIASSETTDQRGVARSLGNGPDIGAGEVILNAEVNTLADSNGAPGATLSLREAMRFANPGSTITFDSSLSGGTLDLALGPIPFVADPSGASTTIDASALPGGLVIDGGGSQRLFSLSPLASGWLTGLTLTGASGSAVSNQGTLNLVNSTLHRNEGVEGGAITNTGTLSLVNCTLADNSALSGGAIFSSAGTVSIESSTVTGNVATDPTGSGGGGINHAGLTLRNSIVAGNSSAVGGSDLTGPAATQTGPNLLNDANPMLGELALQGGNTPTILPLIVPSAGVDPVLSPAINAGSGGPATDQRGMSRFGDRDLGATEVRYVEVEHHFDENGEPGGAGMSLREALTTAGGVDFISFERLFTPAPIQLIHGPLVIDSAVEIIAKEKVTIDGNGSSNLFDVTSEGRLVLEGLTLTGGGSDGGSGGEAIGVNFSSPSVADSVLASSAAAGVFSSLSWNDISLPFGNGPVAVSPTSLQNSAGVALPTTMVAVSLTSAYVGDSGATGSGPESSLMSGYVSWDPVDGTAPEDTGNISVTGLGSEFTSNGYRVVVYFDADQNNRTFDITVGGQTMSAADASTFSGEYYNAVTSPMDANYAVFENLTSPDFTIEVNSDSGRAAVNAFQVLSSDFGASVVRGGAILNRGELILRRCTLHDNHAIDGGAIANSGTAALDHVTLSENSANGGQGGAIHNTGSLRVRSSTIAGNASTGSAPGVFSPEQRVDFTNSIIASHSGPSFTAVDSLVNLPEAELKLNSLDEYTGATMTMPPLPGSPAIDGVQAVAATLAGAIDQRGFPRASGEKVDIGSVELQTFLVNDSSDNIIPSGIASVDYSSLSLRDAVRLARDVSPAEQVLRFDPAVFDGEPADTIAVTFGPLSLLGDLQIDASAIEGGVTLDGGGERGVFWALAGTSELTNLTITGGSRPNGGGIDMNNGVNVDLTLRDCTLANNAGNQGGAIHNEDGILRLENCTLSGNAATISGGGIYSVGSAQTFLTNVTLTANSATGSNTTGGGLHTEGASSIVTLDHVTIAGNSATGQGGGVFQQDSNLTVTHSIIATNSAPSSADLAGVMATTAAANMIGGDPQLQPLGDFGGPTETMPPFFGSPVVDAIPFSAVGAQAISADQRGILRPSGFGSDLGAAELALRVVNTLVDEDDGLEVGAVSLREALASDAEGVFFSAALSGGRITITQGQIDINGLSNLTTGNLEDGILIDADGDSRIFVLSAAGSLGLSGLTLTGGQGLEGGAIANYGGTLGLANCTLFGNGATRGGAVYNDGGSLSLTNCTLSDNVASDAGGAVYSASALGGACLLENCTLTRNSATHDGGATHVAGAFTLRNSIIAGNFAGALGDDVFQAPTQEGANLIGGNPLLAPLGDYGGVTPVHPLLPGSPARDVGITLGTTPPTDQLGYARQPVPRADVGAVESFFIVDELQREGLYQDTDGDGIPDILEGPTGGYPHLVVSVDDSAVDSDGDGRTDANEILALTDPLSGSDKLEITSLVNLGLDTVTGLRSFQVTWTSVPDASYELQINAVLDNSEPRTLEGPFASGGSTLTAQVQVDPARAFFLVRRVTVF